MIVNAQPIALVYLTKMKICPKSYSCGSILCKYKQTLFIMVFPTKDTLYNPHWMNFRLLFQMNPK